MLEQYDEMKGCLSNTDIVIKITEDVNDTIIFHSSIKFETDSHIHCGNIAAGVKMVLNEYLERLIWKYEQHIRNEHIRKESDKMIKEVQLDILNKAKEIFDK